MQPDNVSRQSITLMACTMMPLRFLTNFRHLQLSICTGGKEQHVSLQKIKKSRGNTCVLFPSYRHFNGFTSCFRQLLSAVMKLPVLLLSSRQAIQILASALLARSVLAPLTSFPLVVFIFITFPASSRCHSRCLSRWCTLPSPPTLRADVRRYFKTYLSSKEKDC